MFMFVGEALRIILIFIIFPFVFGALLARMIMIALFLAFIFVAYVTLALRGKQYEYESESFKLNCIKQGDRIDCAYYNPDYIKDANSNALHCAVHPYHSCVNCPDYSSYQDTNLDTNTNFDTNTKSY